MKEVVETLEDPENAENCEELGVENLEKDKTRSGLAWLVGNVLQTVL